MCMKKHRRKEHAKKEPYKSNHGNPPLPCIYRIASSGKNDWRGESLGKKFYTGKFENFDVLKAAAVHRWRHVNSLTEGVALLAYRRRSSSRLPTASLSSLADGVSFLSGVARSDTVGCP